LGVSREVAAGGLRDGGQMQIDRSQREVFRRFADAVHAFSREPDRANLARYLTASRALDESRRRSSAAGVRRSQVAR
jgi:hypothetical protein